MSVAISHQDLRLSHGIVEGEDCGQAALVQNALATGLQQHVIYGRNEPALQHLHRELAVAVGCVE